VRKLKDLGRKGKIGLVEENEGLVCLDGK